MKIAKDYLAMRRGHGEFYNAHLLRRQTSGAFAVGLSLLGCAVLVLIAVIVGGLSS